MKRTVKTMSLVLALAMALSVSACTAKPSRSGIIYNDAQSKPEGGTVTEPVPTATDPLPTDPAVTATPTPEPDITPADDGPVSLIVPDLMYISELCIGRTPDQATMLLASAFGIKVFEVDDSEETVGDVPYERLIKNMDKDIIVDGISFKCIGMYVNDEGLVVDINYTVRKNGLFDSTEAFESETLGSVLYADFYTQYGEPSEDYYTDWVDFDESDYYGWDYSDYWVYLFWGEGCNSVTGNDQVLIGLEHKDPSEVTGVSSSGEDGEADLDDIYEMSKKVFGLDHTVAESSIEDLFGIELGDPRDVTEDTDQSVYTFIVDVSVEGYSINLIEIQTLPDGTVYHIEFINNDGDDLAETCAGLKETVEEIFETEPFSEYPLSEDNDWFEYYDYRLEQRYVLTLGAYYTDFYNYFWLAIEDRARG